MKTPVLETRRQIMAAVSNAFPGGMDCAAARLGIKDKRLEMRLIQGEVVQVVIAGQCSPAVMAVLEKHMELTYSNQLSGFDPGKRYRNPEHFDKPEAGVTSALVIGDCKRSTLRGRRSCMSGRCGHDQQLREHEWQFCREHPRLCR